MPKTGNTSGTGRKRGWHFRVAALLLSLALATLAAAVLMEIGWRLFTPDIRSWLIEADQDGERVLVGNPDANVRREIKDALLKIRVPLDGASDKATNIFALGGSNIAGYFGGPNMAPPRMIEYVLHRTLGPGKTTRVHNLGIAGGTSAHARRLAEEILDAGLRGIFILHMGHNEFLPQNSRDVLARLSHPLLHRVTDLLWGASRFYFSKFERYPFAPDELDGPGPVADRAAAPEWRDHLLVEFRENVAAIIKAATADGSRAILSTVIPNARYNPFQDAGCVSGMTNEEVREWDRLTEEGLTALHADPERALGVFLKMEEKARGDSPFLDHLIARAYERAYERTGRTEYNRFREYYRAALDHDRRPLRAPSRFNDAIRDIAARDKRQVALVDCYREAAEDSPRGVPGTELLRDWNHLWPEAHWRYLAIPLAKALLKEIEPGRAASPEFPSFADYRKERPLLEYQMCTYAAMSQIRFHEPEAALASLERGLRAVGQLRADLRETGRALEDARQGDLEKARQRLRSLGERYGSKYTRYVDWNLPLDIQQDPLWGRMNGIVRSLERGAENETTRLLREFQNQDPEGLALLTEDASRLLDRGDTVRDTVEALALLEMGRPASALPILRKLQETKTETFGWLMSNDGLLRQMCHYRIADLGELVRPQESFGKTKLGRAMLGLDGYPRDPREAQGRLRIRAWNWDAKLYVDGRIVEAGADGEVAHSLAVGPHWLLAVSSDEQRFLQVSTHIEPGSETVLDLKLDQLHGLPATVRVIDGHLVSPAGERMYVYRFQDGREFLVPEVPRSRPGNLSHAEALAAAEEAGGQLLTHGDWVQILIRPGASILERLVGSIEGYLDQLDGSPKKTITSPMIHAREESGEPWREFVSPDRHTNGKPACLSLDGPRLDLNVVEEDKTVPGARARIVYPLRGQGTGTGSSR